MAQCGTMTGGRHRKGHKTRRMRGGMGYGFGGAIGTGGAEWVPSNTSGAYLSNGQPDLKTDALYSGGKPENVAMVGGKRRKSRKGKSKKSGKKSRKSRGRKMRGGMTPGSVNVAPVGASFVGAIPGFPHGGGTYGAYAGYPANVPAGNPHTVGADGVTKV